MRAAIVLVLSMIATVKAAFLAPMALRGAAVTSTRAQVVCAAEKPVDAQGNIIKAALSSYMQFCNERRAPLTAELKASMGSSFKQPAVMSQLGVEWKQLGDAEKARFQALAAQPVA